jgi:hypothetical protein
MMHMRYLHPANFKPILTSKRRCDEVKAAAVQLRPVLYSRERAIRKIVRKIEELGQQGVQFATFPETVVPCYPYFSFVHTPYQIIGGREHFDDFRHKPTPRYQRNKKWSGASYVT